MTWCLTCIVIFHLSVEFRRSDESSLHHLHLHGLHLFIHAVKLGLMDEREETVSMTTQTHVCLQRLTASPAGFSKSVSLNRGALNSLKSQGPTDGGNVSCLQWYYSIPVQHHSQHTWTTHSLSHTHKQEGNNTHPTCMYELPHPHGYVNNHWKNNQIPLPIKTHNVKQWQNEWRELGESSFGEMAWKYNFTITVITHHCDCVCVSVCERDRQRGQEKRELVEQLVETNAWGASLLRLSRKRWLPCCLGRKCI